MAGGYMAAKHLLDLGHKRIGIILTGKSIVELNMEFSLRLQGYRMALDNCSIPYDYDGHPAGKWSIPRLTSVDQNMHLFGTQAAEILIQHPGVSHPGAIIAPRLIVRESTAPPAMD
jgi:DNA-binding LacI/PurR family transcriptional regulator